MQIIESWIIEVLLYCYCYVAPIGDQHILGWSLSITVDRRMVDFHMTSDPSTLPL